MKPACIAFRSATGGHLAVSGLAIHRVLSAELFRETAGFGAGGSPTAVAAACQARWIDLAAAIASVPDPLEFLAVTGGASTGTRVLVVGRGDSERTAAFECSRGFGEIRSLLATTLDYAEVRVIEDEPKLRRALSPLAMEHVLELRRPTRQVPVGKEGVAPIASLGFGIPGEPAKRKGKRPGSAGLSIEHLFPWRPSDDPWWRLLEALSRPSGGAALIVHGRGVPKAPGAAVARALASLAETERVLTGTVGERHDTLMTAAAHRLRDDALARVAILQGSVLAARVFLATAEPVGAALVALTIQSLDDASSGLPEPGPESLFRGGAEMRAAEAAEVMHPLDEPPLEMLFGPREATAVLRTAMPCDRDLPGIPINRARTGPMGGHAGDDVPIGVNDHRDDRAPASLSSSDRFRHVYVVGQTGTGKSTLLQNMILYDIRKGRGVGVLDPHGSLIQGVLENLPRERREDVVILDVTDIERPVGFNVLRIEETDPLQYRLDRDVLVDDLYGYIERTYTKETLGPIFESHFRGMLALLLGSAPQVAPRIPNLMIFRMLYTSASLRRALVHSNADNDPVLKDFITEVVRVDGEWSLKNIAPYITSKFNRFVSDLALRNITCQNRMLDLARIIEERKILLVYLGKGRFGDFPAGLLASQVVSRIRAEIMKRGAGADAPPFYLYADEFQLFADDRFGELLAEARKFGLSLTLAHQFTEQLPKEVLHAVLGNVGTTVAFRVGSADAERLEPVFAPLFGRRDLVSLANFRAYVRSTGALGEIPFSLEAPPPPIDGEEANAEEVRRLSRERYGRPRSEVEAELMGTYEAYAAAGKAPPAAESG